MWARCVRGRYCNGTERHRVAKCGLDVSDAGTVVELRDIGWLNVG